MLWRQRGVLEGAEHGVVGVVEVVVGVVVYLLLSRSGPLGSFGLLFSPAAMIFAQTASEDACSHGEAWSLKPGGISKASGKPYNPFWAASHKAPDGSWCREKPSAKWVAAQSAPAPTKLVPEDTLEELPF